MNVGCLPKVFQRRTRHVRFDESVRVYIVDSIGSSDRRSLWLQYARDRMRFQRRIRQTEKILSPILSERHRLSVMLDRFEI